MQKMNGINVYGVLQRHGEYGWRVAQYLAGDGRWYSCSFFSEEHIGLAQARIHASIRSYQTGTPYLKELKEEREIYTEEIAELLGPLEALASLSEATCSKD